MNKAQLIGRLTKDPVVRYSQGNEPMAVARFTLAVDRRKSKKEGDNSQTADFINCVAFGKTGEFVEKYAKKGTKFGLSGHIQTGSFQHKDGYTVYTTEVVVDEMEFCESTNANAGSGSAPASQGQAQSQPQDNDFMNVPDEIEDELPFN